jgi:hypothetical protein
MNQITKLALLSSLCHSVWYIMSRLALNHLRNLEHGSDTEQTSTNETKSLLNPQGRAGVSSTASTA